MEKLVGGHQNLIYDSNFFIKNYPRILKFTIRQEQIYKYS